MEYGYLLGKRLAPNAVICFFGDLAAGKTTFIKGLVAGAAGIDSSLIQSPTFTYLHIYQGTLDIYHFDLYRLRDTDEFIAMGFDEYFEADGICCIEWSERISTCLPSHCIQVFLTHEGLNKRSIIIMNEK